MTGRIRGSVVDLTHSLEETMPSWGGECGFHLENQLDYGDCSTEIKFRVNRFSMLSGVGTHIDAPAHCIPGGLTVDQFSLENLIAPCVVIDVSSCAHEKYSVSKADIERFEASYGKIARKSFVIVKTGWDKLWAQPEKYRNHYIFPSISEEAAQALLEREIVGLGVDTLSPDRPDEGYPVHDLLLSAGKYIIENLTNLDMLPAVGASIVGLPLKIKGGTEAPIRLVALISELLQL